MTRAIRSLITGHFYQAFRYNNLIIILIPTFFIYYGEVLLDKLNIKNLGLKKYMNTKFFVILLVIVLLYGILRNIPLFSYLIPTDV